MNVLDLLIGKKIMVMTDMKVPVELEITKIEEHSRYVETGPSTPQNDWYPDGYHKSWYEVTFNNGVVKKYDSLKEIEIAS